jgi:hypothetical protein
MRPHISRSDMIIVDAGRVLISDVNHRGICDIILLKHNSYPPILRFAQSRSIYRRDGYIQDVIKDRCTAAAIACVNPH